MLLRPIFQSQSQNFCVSNVLISGDRSSPILLLTPTFEKGLDQELKLIRALL